MCVHVYYYLWWCESTFRFIHLCNCLPAFIIQRVFRDGPRSGQRWSKDGQWWVPGLILNDSNQYLILIWSALRNTTSHVHMKLWWNLPHSEVRKIVYYELLIKYFLFSYAFGKQSSNPLMHGKWTLKRWWWVWGTYNSVCCLQRFNSNLLKTERQIDLFTKKFYLILKTDILRLWNMYTSTSL